MATDTQPATSILSSEAYDLITCFYDGVDEIVYAMAEEVARERNPSRPPDEPIRIELEDVRIAGRRVLEALQNYIAAGKIPKSMKEAVQGMGNCFENR